MKAEGKLKREKALKKGKPILYKKRRKKGKKAITLSPNGSLNTELPPLKKKGGKKTRKEGPSCRAITRGRRKKGEIINLSLILEKRGKEGEL